MCRDTVSKPYPCRGGLYADEAVDLLRAFYIAGNPAGTISIRQKRAPEVVHCRVSLVSILNCLLESGVWHGNARQQQHRNDAADPCTCILWTSDSNNRLIAVFDCLLLFRGVCIPAKGLWVCTHTYKTALVYNGCIKTVERGMTD